MPTVTETKRPRVRPSVAALTLLVVGALIAGCGTDKKEEFKKDFKPVNAQILALGNEVGKGLTNASKTTDAALSREFLGFATRLQAVKGRLDKLDPPSDLKSKRATLSTALGKLVTDLRGIGTAATTHKPAAARTFTVALLRDSRPVADARRALARAVGLPVVR